MSQLTATEEYEALVEGTKQGVVQYLTDNWRRTDGMIITAVEDGIRAWLNENRYAVLDALQDGAAQ